MAPPIPEVRDVHRLRDVRLVRGLDRLHRHIQFVHSVADAIRASIGAVQEHATTVGSRDISAVTARIRRMQARPSPSLQCRVAEDRGSQPVLHRPEADRDHSS